MNINSNYTNIQDINNYQSSTLEKLGTAQDINNSSDNPSGLLVVDNLDLQQNSISQSINNANSGIAMSNIAQSGIASQKELLENIKIETQKAMNGTMNDDDKEIIAKQISKYIDQYDKIAQETNYNGNSLLKVSDDEIENDISIAGDNNKIVSMEKADTLSVSDQLKGLMSDFANNPNSMKDMLDVVDKGMEQLAKYAGDFGSSSNSLASSIRNSLNTETEIARSQSTVLDIDYNKEVSNFSKANLQAQIGMFVHSQANAIQSRNIALLT